MSTAGIGNNSQRVREIALVLTQLYTERQMEEERRRQRERELLQELIRITKEPNP